jgi:DNA gyrase subunit A
VIKTIRQSSDREDAKRNLVARFKLSDRQADAILGLQLHRLTALEREKIEQEHKAVTEEVAGYRRILGDPKEVDRIVKEEVEKTERDFGDARRTEIGEPLDDTVPEDLIPDEEMTVTISRKGYVKRPPEQRVPRAEARRQGDHRHRRAGRRLRRAGLHGEQP